jgi:hypothetical protein
MTARTALFVLGMHRSGTSALARMLSLLGASLPRHLNPPGTGNEIGHWEPAAAVQLHDRLLDAAGTSVYDLYGPLESWFETRAADVFADEMEDLVGSEFGDDPLFVFKDPRSALVFPLWHRVLARIDIRCLTVIISRNPLEVARSVAERQAKVAPGQAWPLDRGGLLWLRYALAAERYTRDTPRSFCLYADLLADWRKVAGRLASDFGLSWPRPASEAGRDIDGFMSAQLRHHHQSGEIGAQAGIWPTWIAPVFATLSDASTGQPPDRAVLDTVGRSFENACVIVRSPSPPVDSEGHPPDDRIMAIRAAAAANSLALLEAKSEARRHARNLQEILDASTESAKRAEGYALALEASLAEHRVSQRAAQEVIEERTNRANKAEEYARSLEASLAEHRESQRAAQEVIAERTDRANTAEEYARSLEASLSEHRELLRAAQEIAEEGSKRAKAAEEYARSLEASLAEHRESLKVAQENVEDRTRNTLNAEEYARSLEASLAEHRQSLTAAQEGLEERMKSAKEAEQYARSLEASLAELEKSLKESTEYAIGLERSRAEMEAYAKNLEMKLGQIAERQ